MGKRYTQEQIAFLREGFELMTHPQLTKAFNDKFGLDKSETAIHSLLYYHGFRSGNTDSVPLRLKGNKYSQEQIEYIREGYKSMNIHQLTKSFNLRFLAQRTEGSIQGALKAHNLHGKRNDGLRSSFTKEIGSERVCSNTGFIIIKVDEPNPYWGGKTRQRHKHLVIWEKANGPIPEGHRIRFLDGNKLNCTLENLALFTMTENMFLNHLGFNAAPDELRKTIILTAKLKAKATERKRELVKIG